MLTVSAGGKTHAHIATLTCPKMLGGLSDKYIVMSPTANTDPTYNVGSDNGTEIEVASCYNARTTK